MLCVSVNAFAEMRKKQKKIEILHCSQKISKEFFSFTWFSYIILAKICSIFKNIIVTRNEMSIFYE